MLNVVRILVLAFLLLIRGVGLAHGGQFYVDSISGSDTNNGTSESTPWKTLAKVNATTFQAGDTINFKRGSSWSGTTLVVDSSGTSTSPVTYQAYGSGNAPTIVAPNSPYSHSITVTGSWNIIRDFLVRDGNESGIGVNSGADHNTILNNEMTNAGTGTFVYGQYTLITHNYAHDLKMIVNDSTPSNDYGAVCFWLNAGNNEVSYNRGINCRAASIDFGYDGGFVEVFNSGDNTYVHHNYAQGTNGFFELGAGNNGSAQNVRVMDNIIYNAPGSPSICLNTGSYNINVTNFTFENNTYVSTIGDSSAYRVFACRTDLSSLIVRNNIFYSNIQIANNGNFTHVNNLYYMVNMVNGSGVGYSLSTGEKTGNPLFVNLSTADFHLQSTSPAIDAGTTIGALTTDYDGGIVPIGSAPDMGAFEYGSVVVTLPAAPTQLGVR